MDCDVSNFIVGQQRIRAKPIHLPYDMRFFIYIRGAVEKYLTFQAPVFPRAATYTYYT